jgi:hypothetical protein
MKSDSISLRRPLHSLQRASRPAIASASLSRSRTITSFVIQYLSWQAARGIGVPETAIIACGSHFPEADFGPVSKSAIKYRIRSAVTQAEAKIAIAISLHR